MSRPKRKIVPDLPNQNTSKEPKRNQEPDSFNNMHPVWRFSKCDTEHEKWGIPNCSALWEDVLYVLGNLEGQKWHEICGPNNHFIPVSNIIKPAQKRFEELNLANLSEQVFSMRITGRKRLFGIRLEEKFFVLWYDQHHEICISKKKHT